MVKNGAKKERRATYILDNILTILGALIAKSFQYRGDPLLSENNPKQLLTL